LTRASFARIGEIVGCDSCATPVLPFARQVYEEACLTVIVTATPIGRDLSAIGGDLRGDINQ